ncbi:MAG: hypothetical protein HUJ26_08100 [Planctomycetaceae bacterium]|nr:hypothetical protein [Planctomycetaceae bacterium]
MFKNRSTEKDLRDWFSKQGWDGESGRFEELELIAIQRPGWLQVFRFSGTMLDPNDHKQRICGYCRDDERHGLFEVVYRDSFRDLHSIFAEWTSELVTRNPSEKHPLQVALLVFFLGCMVIVAIVLARASLFSTITALSRNSSPHPSTVSPTTDEQDFSLSS